MVSETNIDLVFSQLPPLLQHSSKLGVHSALHIGMVEQMVESLVVADKHSVQVESPHPQHSSALVLLVQLPESSHRVTLEIFHTNQLEEVAKLKVSSIRNFFV